MQLPAIRLILEDHRALAAVLRALRAAAQRSRRDGERAPDFERLRAMLSYLDDGPARLHDAAESELLFPRIRARCPALRPVLDRIEAEHEQGSAAVRAITHALAAWQTNGDGRREAFCALAQAHATLHLGHIEVEERYVLPVAGDYLRAADWRELEQALSGRHDTRGDDAGRGHRELLARLVARPTPAHERA